MNLENGHTTHPDAQWYPDAELGLFIHWGISSVHGNVDISWGMRNEYCFSPEIIRPEEYFDLAKKFNPLYYHPKRWADEAAAAGFRYMVLTTRHHDGFAMWPSRFGDFNTKNYMNGRDLVGEYVEACRSAGLKVGLYYSPPDWWTVRDYMSFGWNYGGNVGKPIPQVLQDYVRSIIRGQLTELLTRYGKIDLLWFDGDGLKYFSREEIYELQPHIVIGRDSLSAGQEAYGTDIRSTECEFPTDEVYEQKLKGYWYECCHEWSSCWGYTKDEEYKPTSTIIEWFKTVRKYNGNLLINVAPRPDGELPEVVYERFKELGEWMKEYRKNK